MNRRASRTTPWRRLLAAFGGAALLATTVAVTGSGSTASAGATSSRPIAVTSTAPAPPGGYITNFVKYVHGTPKAANPKLAPVEIGWSSNDGGGTVQSIGPEATAAAQVTVDWINKYADGIDGHPLVLDKCIILNAEEEGLACAEKFLANKNVKLISYGALSVGAATIDSAVAGRKPIIIGFSVNASDIKSKNTYILFDAGEFGAYVQGEYPAKYMHAKSVAVIYPDVAGENTEIGGIEVGAESTGAKVKAVPFDPTTTDLTGALTAAGAQTAGAVIPVVNQPSNCLSAAAALHQLGIADTKVIWYPQCDVPTIKAQYPGGDYPHYYSGEAQSGDALVLSPTGLAYKKALTDFGAGGDYLDAWYSGIFGQMMTTAQLLNEIGYAKLTPASIVKQVKAFHGPMLMGATHVQCGEFRFAPGSCSDGGILLRYVGNSKFVRSSPWIEPSATLVKYLKTLPASANFPTRFP